MSIKLGFIFSTIAFFVFTANVYSQTTVAKASDSTERQVIKEDKIPSGSYVEKPYNLRVSGSKCSSSQTSADIKFNWSQSTASKFKIGWRTESQSGITNWVNAPNAVRTGANDWELTYSGFTPGVKIIEWGVVAIENDKESTPETNSTPFTANVCLNNTVNSQFNAIAYTEESSDLISPTNLSVTNSKCYASENKADMTFNWYHPTATEFEIGWRTDAEKEITNYFPISATEIVDQSTGERTHTWTFTYPDSNVGENGFTPGVTLAEWAVIAVEDGNQSSPGKSGGTVTANTCSPVIPNQSKDTQPSKDITPPSNLSVDTELECTGYKSSQVKFRWRHPIYETGTTFKIAWGKDSDGNWEYVPATEAIQEKFLGVVPTGYWNFTYKGFYTDGEPIPEWVVVAVRDGVESFATHSYSFTPKKCEDFNPPTETLTLDENLQIPDSVDVIETKCLSYNNTSVKFTWHQKRGTATNFQIGWSLTPDEIEYYTPPGIVDDGNGNYSVTIEGFNTYGEKINYWGVRALNGTSYSQTKLGTSFIPEDCSPFNTKPIDHLTECCQGPVYDVNENTISTIEDIRNFSATSIDEIKAELTISPKSPLSWLNVFNLVAPGTIIRNFLRQSQSEMEIADYAVINSWAQQGYSVANIQDFYRQFLTSDGRISVTGLQYLDNKFLEGKFEKYLDCRFKQRKAIYDCDLPPSLNESTILIKKAYSFDEISSNDIMVSDLFTDPTSDLAEAFYLEELLIRTLNNGSIGKVIDSLAVYDSETRQYLDTNDSLGNLYIAVGKRLKGRADSTAKEPLSYVANSLQGQVAASAKGELDSLGGGKHFLGAFTKDFAVGFISADGIITGPSTKVFKATVVAATAAKLGKEESVLRILSQKLFNRGVKELDESERMDFLRLIRKYKAGEVLDEAENVRLKSLYAKLVNVVIDGVSQSKNFDELYSAINKLGPAAIDIGGTVVTPQQLIARVNFARRVYLGDPWNGITSNIDLSGLGTKYGIRESVIRLINSEFNTLAQLSQDASRANTFSELFQAIQKAGTIHGSDGVTAYTPSELINIIQRASPTDRFSSVTRVADLRFQVARIASNIQKLDTGQYSYEAESNLGFGNIFRQGSNKVERTFHNGGNTVATHIVTNETDDVLQDFARQAANVADPKQRIEILAKATYDLGYAVPTNGDAELFFKLYDNKSFPVGHYILNGSVCFEKSVILKAAIDYLSLTEGRNDIKTRMVGGQGRNAQPSCNATHAWIEIAFRGEKDLFQIDPTYGTLLKAEKAEDVYKRLGRLPMTIFE